ncbi:MAG: hypothetical protein JO359_12370, partial [Candidatus Eremiobacteraeota bacterium]|nr:hypothetical protein [Candidatus Eremiobacteraeota bacterium]
ASLLAGLAAQVRAGFTPLVAPPDLPPTPPCAETVPRCPIAVGARFALTGATAQFAAGGNVSATSLQTHPAVGEGRLAATIVLTIASAGGAPLAVRTEYLTLRTFAVPPYVALDGLTDAGAAREASAEGDSGGCDPSHPATCDANNLAPSSTASDTRIHVVQRCVDGGSGACGGQTYVNADPANAPASTLWSNANAQSDGWTR